MIYTIENEFLRVSVNSTGCELCSIEDKADGTEYLWQGDPAVWSGRAPILFPIVGRLIDDEYRFNGKSYHLPKHGFVRKNEAWKLIDREDDMLRFLISEDEKTLSVYPFAFDLIVTYILDGRALRVSHTVVNKNEDTMYFSIGAHPAFNCEIGDRLTFDLPENLDTEKIDLVNSLRLPVRIPVLRNDKDIIITKDLFNEDALILSGIRSECVTLWSQTGEKRVRFHMGGAPWLGIWAKPGAPYVCLEPWWGVNDSFEKKNDLSQKEGIQALPPEELFQCEWTADFSR